MKIKGVEINIKKIKIDKKIRTILAAILIISIIITSIALYREYKLPDTTDREEIIIDYTQGSKFDYNVYNKANGLYDSLNSAGINETYFTKIVQFIDTRFSYELNVLKGDKINVSGTYEVVGVLTTDLWEKRFQLRPKKEFYGVGKVNLGDSIQIDINKYNDMVDSITKDIGVIPRESEFKIIYNIHSIIKDNNGNKAEQDFDPVIVISATNGAFKIIGDIEKNDSGNIKNTITEPRLDILEMRMYLLFILGVLIFILNIFLIMTVTDKESLLINDDERQIRYIRKEYGDLISDVTNADIPKDVHIFKIKSIEDLVKIAVELTKPIIYMQDTENKNHVFFISDGSEMYQYNIESKSH